MNIAVFGACGRVGKSVVKLAKEKGHRVYEIDKNEQKNALKEIDAAIDFSAPEATEKVCGFCIEHGCPLVTGVTGRNASQDKLIDELKNHVTVIAENNFSKGIETLISLCRIAASQLKNWDAEIVETHRKGKADSPSGTAKSIAASIVETKGSFSAASVHSLRCGTNFGRHAVVFGGRGESLTLTHQAENVEIFALGAIEEAEKLIADRSKNNGDDN